MTNFFLPLPISSPPSASSGQSPRRGYCGFFTRFYQKLGDLFGTLRLRLWLRKRGMDSPVATSRPKVADHLLPSDTIVLETVEHALRAPEPQWVLDKIGELAWYEELNFEALTETLASQLHGEAHSPFGKINIFNVYACAIKQGWGERLLTQLTAEERHQLTEVLCDVVGCVGGDEAA